MGRPNKTGVDYFSHDTKSGKTIFTLEARFGNDGYAFWFKLLELLGAQDGLFIDCNNPEEWEYLLAKTRVDEVSASEILELLANLKAIDSDLWNQKIIWCQKFVDRLEATIYRKRTTEIPQKPSYRVENLPLNEVLGEKSTQSKEKKSKEKKSKVNDIVPYETICARFNEICISLSKVASITDKRKQKIKARWNELKSIEAFENLFHITEQSDFLCGKDKEWKCTFDWLMTNDTNYIKVLEGNYNNKSADSQKETDQQKKQAAERRRIAEEEAEALLEKEREEMRNRRAEASPQPINYDFLKSMGQRSGGMNGRPAEGNAGHIAKTTCRNLEGEKS